MRILLVEPGVDFSVADVHHGWAAAFRQLGHHVVDFNLNDRLNLYSAVHVQDAAGRWVRPFDAVGAATLAAKGIESAVLEMWPDLIMITSGFYVPPDLYDLLRARRMTVILNYLEAPYEDARMVDLAAHVDLMLINDPTNLERFRTVNPNTHYMPAAHDPAVHCPGPTKPEAASDFVFVGTGFPSRIAFLEAVDWTGVDAALAGNWAHLTADSPLRKLLAHDIDCCCDNTEAVDLYRATKASANLYRQEGAGPDSAQPPTAWAVGPREIELAATGTFFLRDPRPEGADLFPMLPTFDGPGDFTDKLRYFLARDELRSDLAGQARAAVSGRTFENNARELLRVLAL